MSVSSDEKSNEEQAGDTTPGEWVVGVIGALLTLAVLGFLAHQAVVRDSGPQLDVVLTGVQETPDGFVVSLRVENSGGRTAEAVQVTGEVRRDGTTVDTGSATVSYVPADSHRAATLVLGADPDAPGADLQVGVDGYTTM